ncbi:hypothetical protein [Tabrizicola sp. M-4]|uniref:hypothetical protein n=1 Tax=Tabrizicola sp. M-4 TaxID=3055847 RepID=UPI003DA97F36
MRILYLFLALLLALCLLPLLLALAAGALSGPLGCDRIAASFRNCSLLGTDVSDLLTTTVSLHWLGLITLPVAALLAALLLLLAAIHLLRRLVR